MKIKTIPSRWLDKNGRRLDCGPYMSGAIEARELLKKHKTTPLGELTAGYNGGIYNGPQFVRNYVEDPDCGVPFLTTSSMLQADLSNLPLLSKKDAYSSRLKFLEVKQGMTLITCSGSIGRMAYARKDMEGVWSNQDIMKVVADRDKVLPGYLYAFLAGQYGVPLVIHGTYGAIIQHIEPHHIADLPVPRLGEVETKTHELVQQAAYELAESSFLLQAATNTLFSAIKLDDSKNHVYLRDERRLGWAEADATAFSLRALNYDPRSQELWNYLKEIKHDQLGNLVDRNNFEGHIVFKRIDADPEHAIMLVGQREAFQLRPEGRWISKKSIEGLGLEVPPGTTVIPCHGTLGESELYCRATLVTGRTSKWAYSGDFYRCIPNEDRIKGGHLFAFLRSRLAFRLIRSISTGSKQQYQHPKMMAELPIPRLNAQLEEEIASQVDKASYLRDHALDLEDEARSLVECAIEGGGR